MASDPEASGAPDGASCAEHPERAARFTCPRCGSFVCAACWHDPVSRCIRCLRRDPTEAAPPIAWEQRERSLPARYLATLAGALSPLRTAPAFAHHDVRAAQRFALISAVPFALLAGIIPHTRTLLFKGHFQVQVLNKASPGEIALDVLQAGAVQLTFNLVELLSLLLPFVTLVRAYAPGRQHAAARMLYYRAWLLPVGWLLIYATYFLLPSAETNQASAMLLLLADSVRQLVVPLLLIMGMSATARAACGLGPGSSLIVVAVPTVLMLVVHELAALVLLRVLPPPAAGG